MTSGRQFRASLYLLSADEGGRKQPVALVIGYAPTHWYRPQIALSEDGQHYDCQVEHPAPETLQWFELRPGEEAEVIIKTFAELPVEVGESFRLYEGARLVARGTITEIMT